MFTYLQQKKYKFNSISLLSEDKAPKSEVVSALFRIITDILWSSPPPRSSIFPEDSFHLVLFLENQFIVEISQEKQVQLILAKSRLLNMLKEPPKNEMFWCVDKWQDWEAFLGTDAGQRCTGYECFGGSCRSIKCFAKSLLKKPVGELPQKKKNMHTKVQKRSVITMHR